MLNFKFYLAGVKTFIKKMNDRDVHVGFIRGDYPWRGEREVLFTETLCVASTQPFVWNDLYKMPRINYKTDRKLIALVEDWWNENFEQPPNVRLRVDQVDTCKEMIINGLGYGIVPDLIIDDDPNIHKKTLMNNTGDPIIRKTWMYYHQESTSINTIGAFLNYVRSIDVKSL